MQSWTVSCEELNSYLTESRVTFSHTLSQFLVQLQALEGTSF
jgi:hypothetical protein